MLLLALGGSIFALVRWKVHPRASLMTLIALVIYVIEAVLFTVFIYYLPELTQTMHMSAKATGWLYTVIFFFEDFVLAGVILLLVSAAFTDSVGENATLPHADSGHTVPSADIRSGNPVVYRHSPLNTRSWSLATQLGIPGLNKIIIITGVIILGILILIVGVALMLISPTLLWEETVPGAGPFGFPLIRTTDYRNVAWLCGVALLIVGGIISALGVIAAFLVGYKAGMFDTSEKDK